MKKKAAHRKHHVVARRATTDHYTVLVRSWIFMVAFALMLGMGIVVGEFINTQLNATTPQVAGAHTAR